jgi:hypothetical protein
VGKNTPFHRRLGTALTREIRSNQRQTALHELGSNQPEQSTLQRP